MRHCSWRPRRGRQASRRRRWRRQFVVQAAASTHVDRSRFDSASRAWSRSRGQTLDAGEDDFGLASPIASSRILRSFRAKPLNLVGLYHEGKFTARTNLPVVASTPAEALCMIFAMPNKQAVYRGKRTLGPNSIRAWREHRGLTLERLAERVDSTAATISRIERGQRPYSQPLLEALAEALGCEPSDLVMRQPRSKDDIEIWSVIEGLGHDERRRALQVLKALVA